MLYVPYLWLSITRILDQYCGPLRSDTRKGQVLNFDLTVNSGTSGGERLAIITGLTVSFVFSKGTSRDHRS